MRVTLYTCVVCVYVCVLAGGAFPAMSGMGIIMDRQPPNQSPQTAHTNQSPVFTGRATAVLCIVVTAMGEFAYVP